MFIVALFTIAKGRNNPSVHQQMNGQTNVIYLYYEVLFNHKEDWSSDPCYNMDEPWEHYAKWNKSYTKGQIL